MNVHKSQHTTRTHYYGLAEKDQQSAHYIGIAIFALLPYSGFLSREKTFVNFAFLWRFAKVFSAKIYFGLPQIRESFLRENLFSSNSQKFSPAKEIRYTVPKINIFIPIRELKQFNSDKIDSANY